ncbi:MAG: hypothetical protein C0191_00045 [Mucilaginibacter sp.]|nr:MAG: hypothetical protein C0191_00045 [Mucilaginibacter sp.]HEK20060.1 hypothetical protein [Bacteroidota bacterium]
MAGKKIKKEAVIIPADLFFYPIPLTQPDQWLTQEDLYEHFEPPKGRKEYMGNKEEFISFEYGIATIKLKLINDSEYLLYLHVEKEELHIACTCGMPDEKLCFHAFIGLYNLTWLSKKFDCQTLYWPRFYKDNTAKKFLDVRITRGNLYVEAKPEYGAVYRSGIGLVNYSFPTLIEHATNTLSTKAGDTNTYAYALCYAPDPFRDRHYPVLIPFYGKTNKSGSNVDNFSLFVLPDKGSEPNNNHPYWQQLNDFSKRMYELMRPLTYKSDLGDKELWQQAKETIFDLWQKALPLLINCPYNQSYLLYALRYLREKPMKGSMKPCRYCLERPVLTFILSTHGEYLKLSVEVTVGSRVILVQHKPHFFILDEQTGYCYLIRSIQDDVLLNWMVDNNNQITVLKDDFVEFDNDIISKLASSYPVFFSDRSKKRFDYNYELVKDKLES